MQKINKNNVAISSLALITAISLVNPVFAVDEKSNHLKKISLKKISDNVVAINLDLKKQLPSPPLLFEKGKNIYFVSLPSTTYSGARKIDVNNLKDEIANITVDFVPYKTAKDMGYTRIVVETKNGTKIVLNDKVGLDKKTLALLILKILASLVAVGAVGFGGFAVYNKMSKNKSLDDLLEDTENIDIENAQPEQEKEIILDVVEEADDDVLSYIDETQEQFVQENEEKLPVDYTDEELYLDEPTEQLDNIETSLDATSQDVMPDDDCFANEKVQNEFVMDETVQNIIDETVLQSHEEDNIETFTETIIPEAISQNEDIDEYDFSKDDEGYYPSADEIVNDILSNEEAINELSETISEEIAESNYVVESDTEQETVDENALEVPVEDDFNFINDTEQPENTEIAVEGFTQEDDADENNEIVASVDKLSDNEENETSDNTVNDYSSVEILPVSGGAVFTPKTFNFTLSQNIENDNYELSGDIENISDEEVIVFDEELNSVDNSNILADENMFETLSDDDLQEFFPEEQQTNAIVDELVVEEVLSPMIGESPLQANEQDAENDDIFDDLISYQSDDAVNKEENSSSELADAGSFVEELSFETDDILSNDAQIDAPSEDIEPAEEIFLEQMPVDDLSDEEEFVENLDFEEIATETNASQEEAPASFDTDIYDAQEDIQVNEDDVQEKISESDSSLLNDVNENMQQEINAEPEAVVEITEEENFFKSSISDSDEDVLMLSEEDTILQNNVLANEQDNSIHINTEGFFAVESVVNDTSDSYYKDDEDEVEEFVPQELTEAEFFKAEPIIEEEIDDSEPLVISNFEIDANKQIYLIRHNSIYSVIGIVDEDVFILNKFDEAPQKTDIILKYNEQNNGKDIYILKVASWRALIAVDDTSMENILTLS